ncbi:MAG: OST-HTH/LOTUS domain-containing protein [Candidatus Competibacteraceae bacterium]
MYGFGEEKTPKAFVSACDKFVFTKVLLIQEDVEASNRRQETNQLKANTKLVNLIRGALETASDDSGWANLGSVGHYIAQQSPEFDPRNYGYEKLSELVLAMGLFDIEERFHGSSRAKGIYIRDKRRK